jgi:hypothetical protein
MRNNSLLRSSFAFAAVFAGALLLPGTHYPVQAAQTPHESCCGAITPEGYRLADIIDSMHVEQLWLAHEHVNWETGESDKAANYEGPGKATHCSAFSAALGERLNVYMLRPPDHSQILLASAQAEWFHQDNGAKAGWKPLDGPGHEQRAQQLANQGSLVVIVYESPDAHRPGHIVIVRPSEKSAEALRTEGPQIAQAGTENHSNSIAALSFVHHPGAWPEGVRYYWHPVDWSTVHEVAPNKSK